MPLERRPSMFNSPRYNTTAEQDDHQAIQKSMQALRMKTQESLAESREEIARLEEENEIKQMRIEEINAEMEELQVEGNYGRVSSLKEMESLNRGRARRRWSLAGFGIGGGTKNEDEQNQDERPGRRAKSVEDDDLSTLGEEEPAPNNRRKFTISMKQPSFRAPAALVPAGMGNFDSKMKKEAFLMQRLHDIQEENKKAIEHHETNLAFKEEQVKAMQLAYEEQCNIMDTLEEEIEQLRGEVPDEETSLSEADKAGLKEKLLQLNDKENEMSSQIRIIRRIQNMDEDERKAAVSLLKREILESSIQLNAVKRMFQANKEMLQGDLIKSEETWAHLSIKIALMERVSQKQIRRLQKKAAKGESDELPEILERAMRALEEELMMRNRSTIPDVGVLLTETGLIDGLVNAMLECCSSFAEGLVMLKAKEISIHVGDTIITTLRQMEKITEATETTVSSALFVLEEAIEIYEQDTALLPEDVVQAYQRVPEETKISTAEDDRPNEEIRAHDRSDDDNELEDLKARNDELDRRILEARQKLKGTKEDTDNELDDYVSRIKELKIQYDEGGVNWDKKNEEVEKAFKDVEDAKVNEDKLRKFLQRVARSQVEALSEQQ